MDEIKREQLRAIVTRRRHELLGLVDQLGVVGLNDEQREELRGVLSDELVEAGLQSDDEPNSYGRELETLIDWLGHV